MTDQIEHGGSPEVGDPPSAGTPGDTGRAAADAPDAVPPTRWDYVLVAVVCTVLGLAVGWSVAGGSRADEEEDAGEAGHAKTFSTATLHNLGVRVEAVERSTFTRTVPVAAVVVPTPTTVRPVFAPFGGRVESLEVQRGAVVETGTPLVTLIRDPLPRPELTLTADVLRPARELRHESIARLRRVVEELRIARAELERVERFTEAAGPDDLPALPRQRAIDLRYEVARHEVAYREARHELETHGYTEEQITAIERGASVPVFSAPMWQRALEHNGLWPVEAQRLRAALDGGLPPGQRGLPWVTATVGELAARGLVTAELIAWVGREDVAPAFLDVGVLLERGHSLTDLQRLHAMGALEPVIRVTAPGIPDGSDGAAWDVHDLFAVPGAHVVAGEALVALRDPRRLYLRSEPVGSEVAAVLAAAGRAGLENLRATPLVPGTGPDLDGLRIDFVQSDDGHVGKMQTEGTVAFVEVANTPLEVDGSDARRTRTWSIREGVRYVVHVPRESTEDVYVLPSGAVATSGPDRVVFVQDGDGFAETPVAVAYEDEDVVVVLPAKSPIFPGDRIAVSGAFELSLALQEDDGGGGGHHHPH